MGFLESVRRVLSGEDAGATVHTRSTTPIIGPAIGAIGAPLPGGRLLIDPASALGLPTVYACVSMIADSVSSMPMATYDRATNREVSRQPSIVRRPDPFHPTGVVFRRIATELLLTGDAFVWLTAPDNTGRPTVAIPIPSHEVTVGWNASRTAYTYRWRSREMILNRDIGHIRFIDIPGRPRGIGPIEAMRLSIGGGLEAERYAAEFYTSGGVPTGVLEHPGRLTEEEAERLRAQWAGARGRERSTAVLPMGMSWKPTALSNHDSQFIESRNLTAQDIARAFHVPSALINVNAAGSSLTYQNQEGIYRDYSVLAVAPVTDRIEEAFGQWVPATQEPRFDFTRLLRADSDTRYRVYEVGLRMGILSINEVRELEGLPTIPGADRPAPVPTVTEEVTVDE